MNIEPIPPIFTLFLPLVTTPLVAWLEQDHLKKWQNGLIALGAILVLAIIWASLSGSFTYNFFGDVMLIITYCEVVLYLPAVEPLHQWLTSIIPSPLDSINPPPPIAPIPTGADEPPGTKTTIETKTPPSSKTTTISPTSLSDDQQQAVQEKVAQREQVSTEAMLGARRRALMRAGRPTPQTDVPMAPAPPKSPPPSTPYNVLRPHETNVLPTTLVPPGLSLPMKNRRTLP